MKKTRSTNSFSGSVDSSTDRKEQTPGSDPRLLVNILGGGSLDERNLEALLLLSQRKKAKRRLSSNAIGATRIKLAKIVSECLGIDCQPEDLQPATGANRTNKTLDIYAWEVFARHHNGAPFVAGAFETMTECVKAGKVYIHEGEIYSGEQGK